MQNLVLAQEELFQGIHCDVWVDKNRNPFMTIQQLANALEYKSRNGIEKMLKRNPYLRNKEFSTTAKLSVVEGKRFVERETIVFTKDGIMEVGFLSPKPKAREFRAWARSVLNAFIDGQIVWKGHREQLKNTNKTLSEAIKEAGYTKPYHHSNFYNLIYQTAIGFTAVSLRKARNAKPKAVATDFMTTEELKACEEREKEVITLLGLGFNRDEMKEIFERKGVLYQTTLKLPEMAR
ncbi:prophage antirepressor-like protein [Enterococcus sp. PF1-24]|uniref:BRO family protein n=1 Tax=unclassified Enterococcus TaxID=2608891 RepID=UPI002475E0E2|nr:MULTISPECIES: BRO family protein [unclassified Enterococcus]MDH6364707.1 prophage antirepressor-like protein [Enterococcus sp. PFB1-1]MDH6401817.1 prophage antirepressor-like protein [Enterococcus sp. PF1-24]